MAVRAFYTAERVRATLEAQQHDFPKRAVLLLDEGEASWDPGSTSEFLRGPARITYFMWRDGGVTFHRQGATA